MMTSMPAPAALQNGLLRLENATAADLEAIPPGAPLREVDLRGSRELESIEALARFTDVHRVSLRACSALRRIDALRALRSLEDLDLTGTLVSDCEPLRGLPKLRRFSFMAPKAPWDRGILRTLPALTHLWLGGDHQISDLNFLSGLHSLRFVDLGYCNVHDLTPLADLPALTELELGYSSVERLDGLEGVSGLRVLGLAGLKGLTDLRPLSGLKALEVLVLDGCTSLTDLTPLAALPRLETLILLNCTGITDLSPLLGLPSLCGVSTSGSGVKALPDGFPEEWVID